MKYPRTLHLPQSPGGTRDDRRHANLESFAGHTLIYTEKMDGSNVCLQADACYARSHGHAPAHPSFDAFKALHARVRGQLPGNLQLFGEWCFAKHSIHYTRLPNHFLLFGVRDLAARRWGSWETVKSWAGQLGVPTVPVLGKLTVDSPEALDHFLRHMSSLDRSHCGGEREGFLQRWEEDFSDDEFELAVGKWVRAGHVQSDEHWTSQEIVKNLLQG